MSDPFRTDDSRAHGTASGSDRDAKIEQLLLDGLDHYFAARYELAINVWTRALFLDRSHARARAYIERARSALAEGQRESEELLQNGVAAFHRGDGEQARRLLQAAIDGGAPSEEAHALLERLNRLETAGTPAAATRSGRALRGRVPPASPGPRRSIGRVVAVIALAAVIVVLGGFAAWKVRIDWRPLVALARSAVAVARDSSLPLPRRGEMTLSRARALAAGGHLRDAVSLLQSIRSTDPQKAEADRLSADMQRQLLALTTVPSAAAPAGEKGDRRVP